MRRHLIAWILVGGCPTPGPVDEATDDTDTDVGPDTDGCEGVVDDCGVCDGDNADMDCAGTCFGEAAVDPCGTCDDDPSNDCEAILSVAGAWACPSATTCGDHYPLDLDAGTVLDVDVWNVTGGSVPRLALYAPGEGPGDVNRLTSSTYDRRCGDADEAAGFSSFEVPASGTWTLAVNRDGASSTGTDGTYDLTVQADPGVRPLQASEDVTTTQAFAFCPYVALSTAGGWSCPTDTSCMDTYTLDLPVGVELEIVLGSVGGLSSPLLGLYPPGASLAGQNALTSTNTLLGCFGFDPQVSATHAIEEAGTWTVVVGRHMEQSAGDEGTYRLTLQVTDDGAWDQGIAVDDDVPLQASPPTSCLTF